jgi:hypothetical protein
LRRAAAVASAFVLVGLVACTEEAPAGPETFCSRAQAAAKACTEAADCDGTLVRSCATLEGILSSSTLAAAQACLDSGICSPSYCLTRALRSAQATDAQRELADAFCSTCAPDLTDCQAQFYARTGRAQGALVLPYGDAIASAVEDACTTDAKSCRASFVGCATDTIAQVLGQTADQATVDCLTAGFHRDDDAVGPVGGPQTLSCTPASCNGCCRDDRCIEGAAADACGSGGAACQTCADTQRCTSGQCVEPCGPNNCKGCCDGDACVLGDEKDKCGAGGQACDACSEEGASFICSNQTCIDGACQATCKSGCCGPAGCQAGTAASACGDGGEACVDCGYGRTCGGAKRCELDQASAWSFVVLSAALPSKTKSGESWDPFAGLPDPYVIVYSSLGSTSHTGQTSSKDDTLVPSWVEAPLGGVKAAELLANTSFEIWDHDKLDPDDLVGGCAIAITPDLFDGQVRQVTCPPTASTNSVTMKFKIVKP